jgi:hypothetical protein
MPNESTIAMPFSLRHARRQATQPYKRARGDARAPVRAQPAATGDVMCMIAPSRFEGPLETPAPRPKRNARGHPGNLKRQMDARLIALADDQQVERHGGATACTSMCGR